MAQAWQLLLPYYLLTVAIETPILLVGLSRRHSLKDRFLAGLWLTACTYPIVFLVLPPLVQTPLGRVWYLIVAETFAPVAECVLFRFAYPPVEKRGLAPGQTHDRRESETSEGACPPFSTENRFAPWRDYAAIIAANLASFGLGELYSWFFAT